LGGYLVELFRLVLLASFGFKIKGTFFDLVLLVLIHIHLVCLHLSNFLPLDVSPNVWFVEGDIE
jgi:hypothetical protein